MNNQLINKILEAAVRAPSGDNVQPWEFKVSENFTKIDLYNLPDKDNSYYNYNQMASYIAHGAVIENIIIASGHLGCQTKVLLFPDQNDQNYIAQIELSPAEPQADPLYSALFERYTNRFQFKRENVSEETIKQLIKSVENIDNANINLVNQKNKINNLAKELMVNDQLVFERKDIHGFLFDKIRWNKKQLDETDDGMPVEAMGLNPVERLSFPLLRFWGFVKTANYAGLSRIIGLKCWWNCRNASILGMISVQSNDKLAFVQGGRAVQRLWIEATLQGLALQPIIGLTLLINRLKQNELDDFSDKHTQLIQRTAKTLPDLFACDKAETLIMGFRMGKGNPISVKTRRKKVEVN